LLSSDANDEIAMKENLSDSMEIEVEKRLRNLISFSHSHNSIFEVRWGSEDSNKKKTLAMLERKKFLIKRSFHFG
jgi:hypothetical protein